MLIANQETLKDWKIQLTVIKIYNNLAKLLRGTSEK